MSQIITGIIILTVLGTLLGIGFGDQNDHINGAQMVWDSDSDYGEMEGGSDVEIEEHVSSFFL